MMQHKKKELVRIEEITLGPAVKKYHFSVSTDALEVIRERLNTWVRLYGRDFEGEFVPWLEILWTGCGGIIIAPHWFNKGDTIEMIQMTARGESPKFLEANEIPEEAKIKIRIARCKYELSFWQAREEEGQGVIGVTDEKSGVENYYNVREQITRWRQELDSLTWVLGDSEE